MTVKTKLLHICSEFFLYIYFKFFCVILNIFNFTANTVVITSLSCSHIQALKIGTKIYIQGLHNLPISILSIYLSQKFFTFIRSLVSHTSKYAVYKGFFRISSFNWKVLNLWVMPSCFRKQQIYFWFIILQPLLKSIRITAHRKHTKMVEFPLPFKNYIYTFIVLYWKDTHFFCW